MLPDTKGMVISNQGLPELFEKLLRCCLKISHFYYSVLSFFTLLLTSKYDNIMLFLLHIEPEFTKNKPGSKTNEIENLQGEMI